MARKIIPEKVEEAKDNIISATMDLILQDGFSKLTLSHVAKKVGITKAAIYWYFSSKEELINVMASSLRTTFIDSAKQIALQPVSPIEKIETLVNVLKNGEIHKKCILLAKVFLELNSTNDEIKVTIQDGYKEYIEIVKGIIDEAINAGEIKTTISSVALSRVLMATLCGSIIYNEMFGNQWIDFRDVQNLLLFSE